MPVPLAALLALLAAPVRAGGAPLLPPVGGVAPATSQAPVSQAAVSQAAVTVQGGLTTLAPGKTAPLELTVVVPPGFHVYRDMLQVDLVDAGGLSLGPASLPPGLHAPDPAAPGQLREQYDFDAVVQVPLLAAPPAGEHLATFDVRFQACSGGICLMPRTEQVQARLVVNPR